MDSVRRMLGQSRSLFPKKIQITKNGGPVALLHCAAARAARIRALATALRLNQNYRIQERSVQCQGSPYRIFMSNPRRVSKPGVASYVTILRGKWACKRKIKDSLFLLL